MHFHYTQGNVSSAECLDIINELRKENLKDLLGSLSAAKENEVIASLKKIGTQDPEEPTTVNIAKKLAGEDNTCGSGKDANAKTIGLLGFGYRSAAAFP